ncbi:MAG: amino acid ABC transporter substrate-binding protein [Treponema sp.]|uniref:amino acid ABC transporter substrate-binding protein n=1 Tax=Treponema sp. TaxID=166 RepID=UPI001B7916ED|nr:amino acid ABC transporter substrate-binding protein [Treponema sp.]MBP5401934.1 amino acid ABC transporter substrate-binding protein [Treponema sp.]MBR5932487.1 amino acid ABC transporter substrate-binding protein [Treponema sp.]
MKKITAVLLLALSVISFSCSKKNTKQFVIGLDDAFPPLGFRDANNEITGYDVDLAREVARRLGKEFVAQPINWSAKEQELQTGKIDCIWNGFTMTPERCEAMAFTKPYLKNAQVVVVKKGKGIATLADLKGKVVGVQAESSAMDAINDTPDFKETLKEIVEFSENVTALNDLEIGNVDAVVLDLVVADYMITQGDRPLAILDESLAPEEYGIGFEKSNTALRDQVQKILEEMEADGTVEEISCKWFGKNLSVIGK